MDNLFSTAVIWFIVGFLFFLLEFAVPGFILFFFGIGAWIVAILTFFLDLSVNTQVLIFLGSSLLTVLLFRNWVKRRLGMMNANKELLQDEIIGKMAKAETPILPGKQGKVYFRGTSWNASSADTATISEGDDVIIISHDSITLMVKSAN